MTLKSLFQKDLDEVFFSESDFAEEAYYKRKNFNFSPNIELISLSNGILSSFFYTVLYPTIYSLDSLKISYFIAGEKKYATSDLLGVITGIAISSGSFTLAGVISIGFSIIPDLDTRISVESYKATEKVRVLVLPEYKQDLESIPQGQRHSAQVVLRKSQVPDPSYKDKIEIEEEDWVVEYVALGADGRVNVLSLRRDYRAKI